MSSDMRPQSVHDHLPVLVVAAVLGAAAPAVRAQPCQPFWAAGTPVPSSVLAGVIEFSDPSGPTLFGIWTANSLPYLWRDGDSQWSLMSAGLPLGINLSAPFFVLDDGTGPHLFAEGAVQLGGPTQSYFLRWNGTSWEVPWPTILNGVCSLTFVSADLGDGMAIYGTTRSGGLCAAAKWTGDQWQQLGPPPNTSFHLLTFDDGTGPALYIAGAFTSIGGVPVPRFPRWSGQAWVQAGDNPTASISLGVTFDDGSGPALYGWGSGSFGGLPYSGAILKFDGQHFSLAGYGDQSTIYSGNTIDVFDDGSGPAIYIGGSFSAFSGVPAHGVARYDGHTWSALGEGVHGGTTLSLAHMPTSRGPALFAFGGFTSAGGGTAPGSARWVGCPNCYANCDNSTRAPVLNVQDFICFLNKFAARDPYANCTVDATVDVNDFLCFLNKFAAGCP